MVWFALVGLAASAYSADKQNQTAKRDSRNSKNFAERQYADWEQIFGNPMKNMSSYLGSLTPERFTAVGLENYEKEYSAAIERLDADFAQRGLSNSGLAVQARTDLESQRITDRVNIRRSAEDEVMQRRMQFLSMSNSNAPQNMQNVLSSQANTSSINSANANANMAASAGAFMEAASNKWGGTQSPGSIATTSTTTAR